MSGQIENLYKVQKKDIPKAGVVLADAFQHDPIWKQVFKDEATIDQRGVLFESPIKFCLKYGEVYAPSEHLEGVALWVPGDFADLTIWRMIRSGAIISGMKAMKACTKLAWKQRRIFGPLQADRKTNMRGRAYIYLMVLGVATEFQGQGFGGKLLRALIEESEQVGVPIYVETETERNVGMYERFGFRVLNQITLPIIDLPQWEMVREPRT
jgi:ribosomal protein S18 acetylase RimI-like enzyme